SGRKDALTACPALNSHTPPVQCAPRDEGGHPRLSGWASLRAAEDQGPQATAAELRRGAPTRAGSAIPVSDLPSLQPCHSWRSLRGAAQVRKLSGRALSGNG